MEKKSNTFSVIFYVRKPRSNDEKVPIYARVTINGKRMDLSMKQKIKVDDWSDQKGMAKTKKEEFKILNNYLEQMRSSFVECYRDMTIKKKVINIDTFRKAYYGHDENEMTLCKLVTYHNQDMKETITWGTLKNYFTTQKYLQKYLKERLHISDILLKELNYKFVTDFEYFLKSFKPLDYHKPLSNNGVMKHMERFRKMINVALKNEWMEKDPFKAYKMKFTKYERGFLTAKNNPKSLADGSLFPRISNQRLNGYLKEMADVCKIDKNLTFHLARHTFATTVTLCNGVPIESVSKMLGHTKITTTQVYAKVIESKLSDDMQLLRQKLLNKSDKSGILKEKTD